MIYVDTSVILASLLVEERRPDASFWAGRIVSSRLLEYETWVRVHKYRVGDEFAEAARRLVGYVEFIEMAPTVLSRAVEPFPASVRTLDALHLATADYARSQGMKFKFATYDRRMRIAATAMKFELVEP